ncbi:MAG TPA: S8 family serine peptidase [Chitinophagaceae bacterium]|nr:S8 family serine peptidase [Chitinophagaceae bacterium]
MKNTYLPSPSVNILTTSFWRIVPFLLLLIFAGVSGRSQKASFIRLKNGTYTAESSLPPQKINTYLKRAVWGSKGFFIIQFTKLPDANRVAALNQAGLKLFQYIPDNAYWAAVPGELELERLKNFGISGIYNPQPQDKLSPALFDRWKKNNLESTQTVLVNISCFDREGLEQCKKEITVAGGIVTSSQFEEQNIVQANITENKILTICNFPFVYYVNKTSGKDEPLNDFTRATHGISSLVNNSISGRNLTGNNVVMGVGDDANPTTHIDLVDRVINRNGAPALFHGTHVSGTVGGAGLVNERFTGIAPKSTIVSSFFSNIISNTPLYNTEYNMIATNNSYRSVDEGCGNNGQYDELSSYVDNLSNAYKNTLHVFAAGNEGATTCSPYPKGYGTVKTGWQSAKNTLSVGNGIGRSSMFYLSLNLYYKINDGSSKGPTSDGRIKPEIVAAGSDVWSTIVNNAYKNGFGTSMAAPAITGVAGLLVERYRQLHSGFDPDAALVKALLCNSANDLGNPGPDYIYGFGWLNAKKAVEDLDSNRFVSGTIAGSQTNQHVINVPSNIYQVKIMLYWHDAAASPNVVSSLVNDLDLTVTSGANTIQPWVLNANGLNVANNATRGADHVNNIEQVTIDNPAEGNITVNVNGFNVPQGPQEYVIVYEFIKKGIEIIYPNGGEKLIPNLATGTPVTFITYDGNTDPLTLEYSLDSGTNWTVLSNNIAYNAVVYNWSIPTNLETGKALLRLSRNNTAYNDLSDENFTILGIPGSVSVTNLCNGYVRLSWPAVANATDYEVMIKKGAEMVSIGSTSTTTYDLDGLEPTQAYWVSVRARKNGQPGLRSQAASFIPSGGVCALNVFDNDLKITSIVNPSSGRKNTSSALNSSQTISISIRNEDNAASSDTFTVSYRVNGGAIITETPGVSIAAQQTMMYNFSATYDFSAEGNYKIEAWVNQVGDVRNYNDTTTKFIKQLTNNPVALPFTESFETATAATYTVAAMGLEGLDRCDFSGSNFNSRARTYVNIGFAKTGTKAITLDASIDLSIANKNDLVTTVNLANYTSTPGLRLTFYYRSHQQFNAGNNYVWIRGNDTLPWVQAYNLNQADVINGNYIFVRNIDISEILANADQAVSSSFQIKFGQEGMTSANNRYYQYTDYDSDDGYTFDDISLSVAANDLVLQAVTSPAKINCGLTNTTPVTIAIKNTSNTVFTNVPVSYRINGGTVITENVSTIGANGITNYTFTTPANLSTPGTYYVDTWVKNPSDDFPLNDSITNIKLVNDYVVKTFPYYEGFESSSGYWHTEPGTSSWEWGTPANVIINSAANGTKAWVTNLDSKYNDNELSYLYSPCFDLSSLTQPVLSFSHIYRTEDDCDCDFHWIEYSEDGVTWQKMGIAGEGTNWFDNFTLNNWQVSRTHWIVSSHDVPVNSSSVRFRFVFSSDAAVNYEGVGIDDIHIFEKAVIYTGPENPKEVIKNVSGTGWIHFNDSSGNRIASINPQGQNLGSTKVKVFINDTAAVRFNNKHYYLDRNLVIQPANAPAGVVKVRFYFTDQESEFLLSAGDCDTCSKPVSAYGLGVNKYSLLWQENGTLSDNTYNNYLFIPPDSVDIIPFNNGYYAEYEVSSFSEFWLNEGGVFKDTGLITSVIDPGLFAKGFSLYPNPAKNTLYLSFSTPNVKIDYIKIIDGVGGVRYIIKNPQLQNGIDIRKLSPGIYYLQVSDMRTKMVLTKKFIVK